MEMVYDLLKITVPAIIAVYAVYLTVRATLNKQLEEYRFSISQKNQEVVLPIRLQAYERICLLLERISPNNIIPRLNQPGISAKEFQGILVTEIRDEFNHNLSQQVYMSTEAWAYVTGAVEQMISVVNESAMGLEPNAKSFDLAKTILEKSMQQDSIRNAINYIKEEIRQVF